MNTILILIYISFPLFQGKEKELTRMTILKKTNIGKNMVKLEIMTLLMGM